MNAVTQTEARTIETAAPLEMADPSKNLILVALSQLLPRRSKRNARKMPRLSIPELAASIARIGLLQNLIVIASADGEHYEVVAGDRRLTALKLLAKKHRIPADYEVPCLLVADGSAHTVSLAENLMREQMHPADQFEAFAALVKEGRLIEDIAADFGVSPLVVQRRLKLAHIAPRCFIFLSALYGIFVATPANTSSRHENPVTRCPASASGHFSERGSSGERPPSGLTMRCSYPLAAKTCHAWVSSDSHKPVGCVGSW